MRAAPEPKTEPYSLFEVYGVESEYMIVDRESGDVAPASDAILDPDGSADTSGAGLENLAWANELVMHVLEVNTMDPVKDLAGLRERFEAHVREANRRLAARGARLLPGGAHPWMDPKKETKLWPHDNHEIYATYHRIFDCHRHGWANLQSCQLNLPFRGDDEFARLHGAVRVLLPLLPALAASTPYLEGAFDGRLDRRYFEYAENSARVPRITGSVVPEPAFTRAGYRREILEPLYDDIAPFDPKGILASEWLNARGAMPRFDRGAIEIRIVDMQECPAADLAIAAAMAAVLKHLAKRENRMRLMLVESDMLQDLLARVAAGAQDTPVDGWYLSLLGLPAGARNAGEVWKDLVQRHPPEVDAALGAALETILEKGTLARRMLKAAGEKPSREALQALAAELATGLEQGRQFLP